MIVCPLNTGECNRPISPKPRTAFVMAPSARHRTETSRTVLSDVFGVLSRIGYRKVEGSRIVRHGDYFCSICQMIQGCAFGVAMVHDGLPVGTISNIYLETGMMQGFGKPVVLLVDRKRNLPSDYIRHYTIVFSSRSYLAKCRSLLNDIIKLPDTVYEHIGGFALRAKDYEKAAKYYQEAFLIRPKRETLNKLESISSALETARGIPGAYKQRLLENLQYFCSNVQQAA